MSIYDVRKLELSQSAITEWLKCRYLFHIHTLEGILPRFTPAPMRRGTLIHAGMEASLLSWWKGNRRAENVLQAGEDALRVKHEEWMTTPYVANHLTAEMRAEFEEQTNTSVLIFRRAFKSLQVLEGRWNILSVADGVPLVEFPLVVELPPFKEFHGTLDAALEEYDSGHRWLIDVKTRKAVQPEDYGEAQIQLPVYQYLLRERYGLMLNGTGTYQIRSAVPQEPELNKTKKKGEDFFRVSRANIVTDRATYLATVLKHGQDPALYADHIAKLSDFDRLDTLYRSDYEVQQIWDTVRDTATDLSSSLNVARSYEKADRRTHGMFPRNLNPFTCRACNHRSYCLAGLRGHDQEFMRKTEYMVEGEEALYPMFELVEDE